MLDNINQYIEYFNLSINIFTNYAKIGWKDQFVLRGMESALCCVIMHHVVAKKCHGSPARELPGETFMPRIRPDTTLGIRRLARLQLDHLMFELPRDHLDAFCVGLITFRLDRQFVGSRLQVLEHKRIE